jgi:hypothetical protein
MSVCGLWWTRKRLIAVIVDDAGRPCAPITAAPTRDACAGLLAWLATTAIDALVLSDHSGPIIELARTAKLHIHLAPHHLLTAIRSAAGLIQRPHRHTAALLARWYLSPGLRPHLYKIAAPDHHPNQIPLL